MSLSLSQLMGRGDNMVGAGSLRTDKNLHWTQIALLSSSPQWALISSEQWKDMIIQTSQRDDEKLFHFRQGQEQGRQGVSIHKR